MMDIDGDDDQPVNADPDRHPRKKPRRTAPVGPLTIFFIVAAVGGLGSSFFTEDYADDQPDLGSGKLVGVFLGRWHLEIASEHELTAVEGHMDINRCAQFQSNTPSGVLAYLTYRSLACVCMNAIDMMDCPPDLNAWQVKNMASDLVALTQPFVCDHQPLGNFIDSWIRDYFDGATPIFQIVRMAPWPALTSIHSAWPIFWQVGFGDGNIRESQVLGTSPTRHTIKGFIPSTSQAIIPHTAGPSVAPQPDSSHVHW